MRNTLLAALVAGTTLIGCDRHPKHVTNCVAQTRYTPVPQQMVEDANDYVRDSLAAYDIHVTFEYADEPFVYPVQEDSTDWVALRDSLDDVCGDTDVQTVFTLRTRPSSAPLFQQLKPTRRSMGATWMQEHISVLYGFPATYKMTNEHGLRQSRQNTLHEFIHAIGIEEHRGAWSVMHADGAYSKGNIGPGLAADMHDAIEKLHR